MKGKRDARAREVGAEGRAAGKPVAEQRQRPRAAARRGTPRQRDGGPAEGPERQAGSATGRKVQLNGRPGSALLDQLHDLLARHCAGQVPEVIDLASLDPASLQFVDETLGEGEVSILSRGLEEARIQETALAGVWRLHIVNAAGRVLRDVIEVADVPGLVRATAFVGAQTSASTGAPPPAGVGNARALLTELDASVATWQHGDPAHVINLTLLPQTPQDLALLDERLGTGPVTILVRGYGSCRMTATRLEKVWWVQHFDADGHLILRTLEVTDVPVAALAAQEDIEQSRDRLGAILTDLG